MNTVEMELDRLLDSFDVPAQRKTDYRWLLRNIGVNNPDHPRLGEVTAKLRFMLHRVDL